MAHLGYGQNKYGTTISLHRCDGCGVEFSVCPMVGPEAKWNGCLARPCSTYDRSRDVDAMLEAGECVAVPAQPKGLA